MRILHVTECYDGGVSRAINKIAELTPEHEHYLLRSGQDDPTEPKVFNHCARLPEGHIQRIHALRERATDCSADVIYAHSSWAGFYARVSKPICPVIYEPHCYVFDDPHRSKLIRGTYLLAEKWLAKRSTVTVTLTPHEERLAQSLRGAGRIVRLPNVPTIQPGLGSASSIEPKEIVMVGRLARQKDPEFFLDVAQNVLRHTTDVRFIWIGDGDDRYKTLLTSNNIEVTGWLNKDELVERLSRAFLYFHSASYEGFPLSVLDAAAVGLPVIVRDLRCFEGFALRKVRDVDESGQAILSLLQNRQEALGLIEASKNLLTEMNSVGQRKALDLVYEYAYGGIRAQQ